MANGATIRAWARANGYNVGNRGRLAPAVRTAFAKAHPDAEVAQPDRTPLGICRCGRKWGSLRQCHCTLCHQQFSTVHWFDEHRAGRDAHSCHDILRFTDNNGEPRFKISWDAWGPVVVLAKERPELEDDAEPVLL